MGTTRNLLYMYVCDRPCADLKRLNEVATYSDNGTCNKFIETAKTDGVVKMLDTLASMHYFKHINVFIDSTKGIGRTDISQNTTIAVVPNMNTAIQTYLGKEDIVLVRGGFKVWIPVLEQLRTMPNWVLFYRANTGNGHWPYWDIILDDLLNSAITSRTRWYYPFVKPVNEDIFDCSCYPEQTFDYDLCIGASHIHRKKGQCNIVKSIFKNIYVNPFRSIVIPGGFIRCFTNLELMKIAREMGIILSGNLHKEELANLFNSTRIFVHSGTSGQNDRSLLEALCCGVPSCVVEPRIFPAFIGNSIAEKYIKIIRPENLFEGLKDFYFDSNRKNIDLEYRKNIRKWYLDKNGLRQVALPSFLKLLSWLDRNSKQELVKIKSNCMKNRLVSWIEYNLDDLEKMI